MGLKSKMPLIIATGVEYEKFLCKYIRKAGFDCDTTPATGDQGVDLVVQTDRGKVAVQCKFYSTPVGNDAVQQVAAGKVYYRCKAACVVSNMTYTDSAVRLAKALKVELLHHTNLLEWLGTTGIRAHAKEIALLKKTSRGDVCACEKLGLIYYRLNPPMFDKARACFERIVQRDPTARIISRRTVLLLARMCANGIGGAVDKDRAFAICGKAGIKRLNGVEVPPYIEPITDESEQEDGMTNGEIDAASLQHDGEISCADALQDRAAQMGMV